MSKSALLLTMVIAAVLQAVPVARASDGLGPRQGLFVPARIADSVHPVRCSGDAHPPPKPQNASCPSCERVSRILFGVAF
jgi:hypothetical protein